MKHRVSCCVRHMYLSFNKDTWDETSRIEIEWFHHNENASNRIAATTSAENTWNIMDSERG